MENRRVLVIAFVMLACIAFQVSAYTNTNAGGHPTINRCAVDYFEEVLLPQDQLLKSTSIRGEESYGLAWDESDGTANMGPRDQISKPRSKLLKDWIMDGGFSADEPERTMALIHFYDPTNRNQSYLTDTQFLVKVGQLWYGADFMNPQISAVSWAFDYDLGSGYFIQSYSWDDGLRYYEAALGDDSRNNYFYGQAWRSVGETMHLMSDMTVPAHVRNDGHPISEPYEDSVGTWEVTHYKNGKFLELDYGHGTLRDLMIRVATKVNKNFYSADTLPTLWKDELTGKSYFTNFYSQPSLEGLTPDEEGYYYSPVPGVGALARETYNPFKESSGDIKKLQTVYTIDQKVLNAQRSVLIPTAIRASAEVLDRFLPRFEARLSVEKYSPDDPSDTQYLVRSTLKQVHTEPDAWSGHDLIVRNGAYLVEVDTDGTVTESMLPLHPVLLSSPEDPNFNRWQDIFFFKPGTVVYMKYDLGGYVITSNKVTIPKPTTTMPTPTTVTTMPTSTTVTTDTATVVSPTVQPSERATWGCVNTAACTPDHPENCCPGTTFDDSPCAGCEPCCVWVNQTNPITGEQGYYAVRAFCSCETGETLDKSAVDTNPWSGVPGYS